MPTGKSYARQAEALDAAALAKLANVDRDNANRIRGVCPNCEQYQRGDAADCLNRCRKRGFADN